MEQPVNKPAPVIGQLMHPVITEDIQDDPWSRNYHQPPKLTDLVPRSYPLIDARPLVSRSEYAPLNMLQSHGFAVVKHHSTFLEDFDADQNLDTTSEAYHSEIKDLVRKTTGAKSVFVTNTVLRRGKRAPEPYKLPTGLSAASKDNKQGEVKISDKSADVTEKKPPVATKLALAAPIRVPHLDYTPLGARATIRSVSQAIRDAAAQSGVISGEDKLCESLHVQASSKEADSIIVEQYNKGDELGPRYAAFSVWRPLAKVERDPLVLCPRKEIPRTIGGMAHWNYQNKIPGAAELGGDFLREYAMLGVQHREPMKSSPRGTSGAPLEWFYMSEQQPDEVYVIKLFDSASLGSNAQHAGAPWHASPEIGDVYGDKARESIELRVLAFW